MEKNEDAGHSQPTASLTFSFLLSYDNYNNHTASRSNLYRHAARLARSHAVAQHRASPA